MRDDAVKPTGLDSPKGALHSLERALESELKSLSAGAAPLLEEVRAGVGVLFPDAGGTRLAPTEQQARQEALLKSLQGLEEVLEALQLAARAGRPATRAARGEG